MLEVFHKPVPGEELERSRRPRQSPARRVRSRGDTMTGGEGSLQRMARNTPAYKTRRSKVGNKVVGVPFHHYETLEWRLETVFQQSINF